MNRVHLWSSPLRFPRTMASAFKDATYASAIEIPRPSLFRRLLVAIKEVTK